MEKGTKVEIRNIGSDENVKASWASAEVIKSNGDGTHKVRVRHEGHALDTLELTVDGEHLRAAQ